jgi:hypothetical protein
VEVEEAAVVDDVVVALVQDQDLEMSKISEILKMPKIKKEYCACPKSHKYYTCPRSDKCYKNVY